MKKKCAWNRVTYETELCFELVEIWANLCSFLYVYTGYGNVV